MHTACLALARALKDKGNSYSRACVQTAMQTRLRCDRGSVRHGWLLTDPFLPAPGSALACIPRNAMLQAQLSRKAGVTRRIAGRTYVPVMRYTMPSSDLERDPREEEGWVFAKANKSTGAKAQ